MTSSRDHKLPYLILLEALQAAEEKQNFTGTLITLAGCGPQPSPLVPGVFGALLWSGFLPFLDANLGQTPCDAILHPPCYSRALATQRTRSAGYKRDLASSQQQGFLSPHSVLLG